MFPHIKIPFQFSKFFTREQMEKLKQRIIEEMCRFINRTRDLIYADSSTLMDSSIILPLAVKCKYGIPYIGYWSNCVGDHVSSQNAHSVPCKIS